MMVAERQRRTRFTGRLRATDPLHRSIAPLLQALQKEFSALDRAIDEDVRGSPAWRKEDLLASVPGVEPFIARPLLAEMPEPGTLDRCQIVGLAPWTR